MYNILVFILDTVPLSAIGKCG